jgi:hypothetical protein
MKKGSVILGIILVGITGFFAISAFSYHGMARFVPLVLSVPTLCLVVLVLLGERFPAIMSVFEVSLEDVLARGEGDVESAAEPAEPKGNEFGLVVLMFAWFSAFAVVLFFAGFYIASALFALFFTRFQGKIGWFGSILMAVLGVGFFYFVFQETLNVDLFEGLLFGAQVPPL